MVPCGYYCEMLTFQAMERRADNNAVLWLLSPFTSDLAHEELALVHFSAILAGGY